MGVSGRNAWVNHRAGDGTVTRYTVYPPDDGPKVNPDELIVQLQEGPDALDHDEVRSCATTAYIDAYGTE